MEHIRDDQPLPLIGAHEFRYLARTYNKMYDTYHKSIKNLSFTASHDKLTGLYNRSGYDLIVQSVDLQTTALLLFDADRFKEINDTYGHETGDMILRKIADTLKRTFRSEDFICRFGGDEFVVLMVHINQDCRELVEKKVQWINQILAEDSKDLPAIAVSAGISYCSVAGTVRDAFRQADIALYHVKENGRNGCCVYTPGMENAG